MTRQQALKCIFSDWEEAVGLSLPGRRPCHPLPTAAMAVVPNPPSPGLLHSQRHRQVTLNVSRFQFSGQTLDLTEHGEPPGQTPMAPATAHLGVPLVPTGEKRAAR